MSKIIRFLSFAILCFFHIPWPICKSLVYLSINDSTLRFHIYMYILYNMVLIVIDFVYIVVYYTSTLQWHLINIKKKKNMQMKRTIRNYDDETKQKSINQNASFCHHFFAYQNIVYTFYGTNNAHEIWMCSARMDYVRCKHQIHQTSLFVLKTFKWKTIF